MSDISKYSREVHKSSCPETRGAAESGSLDVVLHEALQGRAKPWKPGYIQADLHVRSNPDVLLELTDVGLQHPLEHHFEAMALAATLQH